MAEEVEDFPRGGARVLTPLETRKIKESALKDAKKDILFGNYEPEKKKKKKIRNKDGTIDSKENVTLQKFVVNHFTFKYLVKGMLVLGYVKEIYKSDIVIGLPNSLSGYLKVSDLRSSLRQESEDDELEDDDCNADDGDGESLQVTDLFTTGELVPVSVQNLYPSKTGYQKIVLSVLPEHVNAAITKNCIKPKMLVWGRIQSVEDHGYVISIGKDKISGFLQKGKSLKDPLKVGMMKWFCVQKMNANKVMDLSADWETISKAQVNNSKVHFNSLLPGQLVNMTITEVSEDGACGTIFDGFEAVVESLHMQHETSTKKLTIKKVLGRIIHINPTTKQIGVSPIPDVVAFPENVAGSEYKIGDIVEECVVVKFESSYGLFMKMQNETFGVVHISRISDEHTEKVGKKHKAGTEHKCRVLGYSALDSAYILTLKKSDLDKPFLRYDDLRGGMTIAGEVISLEDFGCLVKITSHIRGLCPKIHLSDINLKHPERKFEEGKKLKFKVLYVKPETRKLILTHKKTLLKSKLPLVLSIDDIKVGDVVHGFVSKIKSFGVFVTFYNEIKALLPKSEITIPKDSSLTDLYYVGQVVQCTVITVDKAENKFVVSVKEHNSSQLAAKKPLRRGDVVCTSLLSSVADNNSLMMSCDGNDVLLPPQHYSDFNKLNEQWHILTKFLKADFALKNAVVIGYHKKMKGIVISQKEVLVQDGCQIKSFEDLKVGLICGGVVSHIMPYGIFVEVSPDITGLVPISLLADQYVKNLSEFFYIGQSLIVKVTEIDEEKHRFLIASKPSVIKNGSEDNSLNNSFSGNSLFKTYLLQRKELHTYALNSTDTVLRVLPSLIGEIVIAKITKADHDGILLSYYDEAEDINVDGCILPSLRFGAEFEVGKECQCYVFNVDLKTKKFHATSHEDAIAVVIKNNEDGKEFKFPKEKKIDALVVDIEEDIVTLLLPDQRFKIAYMSSRRHLNVTSEISSRVRAGQSIFVKFESMDELGIVVSSVDVIEDVSSAVVGSLLTAVVKGIKPTQLSVTLLNGKMHGRVHISNIADKIEDGKAILADFEPMQLITVKIIGFRDMKTNSYLPITKSIPKALAELSLQPSIVESAEIISPGKVERNDFEKGDNVACYVTSVTKKCVWLSINPSTRGRISVLHFSDDQKEVKKLSSTVKQGFAYNAYVLGQSDEHNCLELSRIGDSSKLIANGNIVIGRISRILGNGLLIEIPDHKAGVVNFTELHDSYKDDPLQEFSVNQIVKCQILSVKKGDQIDLSLRESRLSHVESTEDYDKAINGYDDLKDGDVLRGYIKSCSKVGVFVSLSSNITGRVQIKNLSQFFVKNYMDMFPVGRLVKAKILSIDPVNNRIDLSLRGKDVGGPDLCPAPKRKSTEEDEDTTVKKVKLTEDADLENESEHSDSDSPEEVEDEDENEQEESAVKPCLQLSMPFDWTCDAAGENEIGQSSDSDGCEDEDIRKSVTKKTKRQKRAAKKAEEENLHKTELALVNTKCQFESAEDFDKLILSSPDSSLIWIQYMAFHLHSAEIEKARAVAEKALKTISYREEQEKFNVWVSLLNLESMYGTSESLEKAFQEALKLNEPKKVYSKMVDIYIKSEKKVEAEKMYQVMIRKFRSSMKVWTGYGYFLMKTTQVDAARKLLQRSLKSLPQRKHVETIVKFAVMEYKMGEPNRGSTIFESILKNYPKRTDLWSIYIDMNIKEGDLEQVRNTFERATALIMNAKKMKFLFKKYLDFEEQYGNKDTVDAVRKKALEYVENKMGMDAE